MALSRKMLKAMGIEDEKIDQIIEAHSETVDGLKGDIAKYKPDAEKLDGVQKELDGLKAKGDDGWKDKYEKEHKALEDLKADNAKKASHAAKESAYRELLKEAGISEKRIDAVLRVSDVDSVELDEKGTIKDAKELTKTVKTEWADFIVTESAKGADTNNPPANGKGGSMTKEEIMNIKDAGERQKAIAENPALFGIT